MKLICFRGISNTGKSTIIKKILNDIYNIHLIPLKKKDFSLIFRQNDSKIGICNYGDNQEALEKYLKPLKDKNCDIIICACHPKGQTFDFIEREFNNKVTFIDCEIVMNNKIESNMKEKIKKFKELIKVKVFWRKERKELNSVLILTISEFFLILSALLLSPFFPRSKTATMFIIGVLVILGAVGIRYGIKD